MDGWMDGYGGHFEFEFVCLPCIVAFITTLRVHRMLATNHEAVPTPVPTQVQLPG